MNRAVAIEQMASQVIGTHRGRCDERDQKEQRREKRVEHLMRDEISEPAEVVERFHAASLCGCCETHNAPRTLSGPPSTRAAISHKAPVALDS